MEETVRFYETALGLRLRAIFPMHGIPQVFRVYGVAILARRIHVTLIQKKQNNSDRMI